MAFLKNRRNAAVISALLIILSIFFGVRRSVLPLIKEYEDMFYSGTDGKGIAYDLDARAGFAQNLIVVASRYLPQNDSDIKALSDAAAELGNASAPSEKYKANIKLTEAADKLNNKLDELPLTDKDISYKNAIKTDLTSRDQIISRNSYNEEAERFNKEVLGSFPLNILKNIVFISDIELYK